jgi:hypothetical protein
MTRENKTYLYVGLTLVTVITPSIIQAIYSGRLNYRNWQALALLIFALVALGMFWFVIVSLRKQKPETHAKDKETEIFRDSIKDWREW